MPAKALEDLLSSVDCNGSGSLDYRDYFKGKKRLWEVRIQFKFKQPPPPETDIWFGIEMEKYVHLSDASKRVAAMACAAIRKAVGDLYQSPGDDPSRVKGEIEKPTCVLSMLAFDQFIVNPEGEEPVSLTDVRFPTMGKRRYQRISEYARELDEMKRNMRVGATYTVAFWGNSRWLDVLNWRLIGIPIFTPLDFDKLAGCPPVYAVLYTLAPSSDPEEKRHLSSQKQFLFRTAIWTSTRRPQRARFEALTGANMVPRTESLNGAQQPQARQTGITGVKAYLARTSWYTNPTAVRIRTFLNGKFWALLMVVALLLALFLPDIFTLAGVADSTFSDIVLTAVMVGFVIEFILLTAVDVPYLFSFFQLMDVFGTVSMIFDISYMQGQDATQPVRVTQSSGSENVIVVRAARAAKLGARAGRLSRVLKILRFLPFISNGDEKNDRVKMARVISAQLTNVLSTRVAFLTITVVVILPIFGIFAYPEADDSMIAWAKLLSRNAKNFYDVYQAEVATNRACNGNDGLSVGHFVPASANRVLQHRDCDLLLVVVRRILVHDRSKDVQEISLLVCPV